MRDSDLWAVKKSRETRCPLKNDWKEWSIAKRGDRLFMSCPGCGKYGSHVPGLGMAEKERNNSGL
jgi:hypothetical protein